MRLARGDQVVRFEVPGEPMGQPRHRTRRQGGRLVQYDPPRSKAYKAVLQHHAMLELRRVGRERPAFEGPLDVAILATFTLARSHHRKRAPRPRTWRATKPDIDNVAKIVLDACNGILWRDDEQVAMLTVRLWTGAQGEPPSLKVQVAQLDPPPEWRT